MEKTNKRRLTSIIFSVIIMLFMLLVTSTNMLKGLENLTYDYVYEKENSFNDRIVIVGIDEKSIKDLGELSTWNRGYYASVINNLNTYDPSVIGLDIMFTAEQTHESDTELINAAKASKNIVFGLKLTTSEVIDLDDLEYETVVSYADENDPVYQSFSKDDFGYVNTIVENQTIRQTIMQSDFTSGSYSSFAYQIYKKYADANDLHKPEYKANKKYLINYNGKPGEGNNFEYISFSDVYNNNITDSEFFKDKIVLVGYYLTGNATLKNSDEYYTPISRNKAMFGVEIHANIINNIENDMFIGKVNKAVQYIINILVILAVIYVISRFGFLWASITAAGSIIFEFLLGLILYNSSIYYPTSALCLVIFIGYIVIVVYNYVRERLEKGAVIKTFKQYMAPQVVEAFMKDNKQSSNLIGERRDVACLFVDIRGFTHMSETLVDPVKVVKILNDYLGMTTKQIFDNDGMLDKFIGDACMAIFNAPFDIDDYEFKAIKAGLGIVKNGEAIAKQVLDDYGITIGFGVGVNCGEAIIGNIGCDFRKDYTGIGDTINTASRLESNAKGGQVIISEETLNRVDENGNYKLKDRLIVEENGYLNLKGKTKPVLTYNVIGIKEVKEEENGEVIDDSKN